MKNITKAIALFMVAVIGVSVLTGCGEDAPKENKEMQEKLSKSVVYMEKTDDYIVKDGKSEYVIVIPNDPTLPEQTAAQELQSNVMLLTGVTLPLKSETQVNLSITSKIISVGDTSLIKTLESKAGSGFDAIDYGAMNGDGFIIKSYGSNLFLKGANDRGTVYSVYDLMEKIGGVKYLSYNYSYYPETEDLYFYEMDVKEIPCIAFREYAGGQHAGAGVRNKLTSSAAAYGGGMEWCDVENYNSIHNSMLFVPTSEYYATEEQKRENYHLYARSSETFVPDSPREVCWTDGIKDDGTMDESMELSTIKIALESLKKYVVADPDALYFMFGQEDHSGCCQCDKCKEMAEKYGRGGIAIRFCNILAREIQKWANEELGGRKIYVSTFAYMYSDNPPVKFSEKGEWVPIDDTCVAADNLYIRLAPIDSEPYYSIIDENQASRYNGWTKKWQAVSKRFFVWNYQVNFSNSLVYYPKIHTFGDDLREYCRMGVKQIFMQGNHIMVGNWQAIMNGYVAAKILWNVDLDPIELRNEFIKFFYGEPAYETMLGFIEDLDEFYCTIKDIEGVSFGIYDQQIYTAKVWSGPQIKRQLAALDGAIAAIENSEMTEEEKSIFIDHIKQVKLTPLCILLYNYDTFYLNDANGKKQVAKEFFRLFDYFEIKNTGFDEELTEIREGLGI